jgi:hypothetical protein
MKVMSNFRQDYLFHSIRGTNTSNNFFLKSFPRKAMHILKLVENNPKSNSVVDYRNRVTPKGIIKRDFIYVSLAANTFSKNKFVSDFR